jgi:hypothetical protein
MARAGDFTVQTASANCLGYSRSDSIAGGHSVQEGTNIMETLNFLQYFAKGRGSRRTISAAVPARRLGIAPLAAAGIALVPVLASAQEIDVGTASTSTVTFPGQTQTLGPFPFTDIGIQAQMSVSPQVTTVTTGGSTAFNPLTTITGGETFTPGSTQVDIGYTPGWTGSLTTAVKGNVQANLTFGIGPFHDSLPALSANLNASASGNLTPALQANGSGSASGQAAAKNVTLNTGVNVDLGPCPVCVHLADVNIGVTLGAKVQQTVTWQPTVSYGDLVWYSTSKTFSAADNPVFVAGGGGKIINTFSNPSPQLTLSNGQTIFMNILPVVKLTMPVTNKATTSVPASFAISYNLFGTSGSKNFPLGDLWDLSTGTEAATINGQFNASSFYSVALDVGVSCSVDANGSPICLDSFETPGDGGGLGMGTGGPDDMPPTDQVAVGGPDGGPSGPGTGPTVPLFPNGACAPVDANDPTAPTQCATSVTFVPESGTLAMFATGLLALAFFRSRRPPLRRS